MVDSGLLAFAAGLAGFYTVAYLAARGRKGPVEVHPGYIIVRAGIRLDPMEPGFAATVWRLFGAASSLVLAAMAALFYYFAIDLFVLRYISPPEGGAAPPGFIPLIPGVTLSWKDSIYIMLAVGVAALVHELAHAYVARSVGVRVRDAGLALFLFIPAAFVEPDEDSLRRAPRRARIYVYSAGVGANTAMAVALLAALGAMLSGALVVDVASGSPADAAGLEPGDVIVAVNGTRVESVADLVALLEEAGIGDPGRSVAVTLTVERDGSTLNLTVVKPEGEERIGIVIVDYYGVPLWASTFLRSLYLISLSLAVINAAPLAVPLPGGVVYADGGHVLRELAAPFIGEDRAALAAVAVGIATLLLVLPLMGLGRLAISP